LFTADKRGYARISYGISGKEFSDPRSSAQIRGKLQPSIGAKVL